MRIVICDDDALFTEQLLKYVHEFFKRDHLKCPEIACFSDGESLLADTMGKDILFLDVEMPGVDGIYVGNELKKKDEKLIIFIVTSYAEYLDEAMRFHVFRYLSKPLDRQRLFRNLKDAIKLYHNLTPKIPIETKEGVFSVTTSDIVAVEAQGHKILVHTIMPVTADIQTYISIHTMQYWLDALPQNCFFLTHRSFIVNFEHVTDFDHSLIHLYHHKCMAYLTKRKYSAFKNAYFLYLKSTR